MNLQEIGCQIVYRVGLMQGKENWQALMNTTMNNEFRKMRIGFNCLRNCQLLKENSVP